jgi:hypothetical protein
MHYLACSIKIYVNYCHEKGAPNGAVICGGTLQAGKSRVRFPMVSYKPTGRTMADSASKRNEYQVYFLVGKGGLCLELTTLPLL